MGENSSRLQPRVVFLPEGEEHGTDIGGVGEGDQRYRNIPDAYRTKEEEDRRQFRSHVVGHIFRRGLCVLFQLLPRRDLRQHFLPRASHFGTCVVSNVCNHVQTLFRS